MHREGNTRERNEKGRRSQSSTHASSASCHDAPRNRFCWLQQGICSPGFSPRKAFVNKLPPTAFSFFFLPQQAFVRRSSFLNIVMSCLPRFFKTVNQVGTDIFPLEELHTNSNDNIPTWSWRCWVKTFWSMMSKDLLVRLQQIICANTSIFHVIDHTSNSFSFCLIFFCFACLSCVFFLFLFSRDFQQEFGETIECQNTITLRIVSLIRIGKNPDRSSMANYFSLVIQPRYFFNSSFKHFAFTTTKKPLASSHWPWKIGMVGHRNRQRETFLYFFRGIRARRY